jgi:hypothetical protein
MVGPIDPTVEKPDRATDLSIAEILPTEFDNQRKRRGYL